MEKLESRVRRDKVAFCELLSLLMIPDHETSHDRETEGWEQGGNLDPPSSNLILNEVTMVQKEQVLLQSCINLGRGGAKNGLKVQSQPLC